MRHCCDGRHTFGQPAASSAARRAEGLEADLFASQWVSFLAGRRNRSLGQLRSDVSDWFRAANQ
jgi:hypothetical protein